MALGPGARLGPYEVTAAIGAGGMGEVYKARDTRLDRTVAVKVLPEHVASDSDLKQRFEREAKTLAALSHPHICPVFDVGSQDEIDFLVMEHLEGETLERRLKKGALPLDQALQIGIQIADALAAAHRAGIVHRDLKPGNIMLTKAGAKLLDFGLAKIGAPAMAGSLSMLPTTPPNLTAQGAILGTFEYMAPEQLEGREADARTDIFAFGTVLYEMVTGKKAFEGKNQASLIAAILEREPPAISTLQPLTPPAVDHIVTRCLAKGPDERWQSAADLMRELKWAADTGSQTRVTGHVIVRSRKGQWLVAAAATVVVVAAIALALPYLQRAPANQIPTSRMSVLPPANAVISSDSAPIVSPDGRTLAFVARDSSGRALLWIRRLDSLAAQPLNGTEEARQPFWSPDSRFLGFFSQGKLKKIDISGGSPQIVADTSATLTYGATWGAGGLILIGGTGVGPLQSVPAMGGQLERVRDLNLSLQERSHGFPSFLPDGHHFIYTVMSARSENNGVYVASVGSPDTKRLLSIRSEVRYAPPGYLLFVRDGTLMAQTFDVTRLELSGEPVPIAEQVVSDAIFGNGMFSASANGVLVYRAGGESGNTQLTWFDRSGRRLGTVGPPGEYMNPLFSPDERRVVFERRSAQGDRDVWMLELSRGTTTRFTFNPSDDQQPVWSPDGSRIVFASNRDKSYGLYQKPSNGTGNEELLFKADGDVAPMSWSPDGGVLLFRRINKNGFNETWALPLTGERKPFPYLQSEDFSHSAARLSPDGRWVAYYSLESGRLEAYLQTFPKPTGKWQVSTTGGIQPQWSRDGKELFFLGPDQKLMAVSLRSGTATPELGTPQPLFEVPVLGGYRVLLGFRQQYDFASDGRRVLVNVPAGEETGAPITVVLNWDQELKRLAPTN